MDKYHAYLLACAAIGVALGVAIASIVLIVCYSQTSWQAWRAKVNSDMTYLRYQTENLAKTRGE